MDASAMRDLKSNYQIHRVISSLFLQGVNAKEVDKFVVHEYENKTSAGL